MLLDAFLHLCDIVGKIFNFFANDQAIDDFLEQVEPVDVQQEKRANENLTDSIVRLQVLAPWPIVQSVKLFHQHRQAEESAIEPEHLSRHQS